jgi:hypothetical protein
MKTQNNPFKIVSALNLFLVFLLFLDTFSVSKDVTSEKFDSITTSKVGYSGYKSRGGYELRSLLVCQNNHLYSIGNIPDSILTLNFGDNIKVVRTSYFAKTSLVGIEKNSIVTWINVSFLSNIYIITILALAALVSIIHMFYYTSLMDAILALSSVAIYFTSGVYFFYF